MPMEQLRVAPGNLLHIPLQHEPSLEANFPPQHWVLPENGRDEKGEGWDTGNMRSNWKSTEAGQSGALSSAATYAKAYSHRHVRPHAITSHCDKRERISNSSSADSVKIGAGGVGGTG